MCKQTFVIFCYYFKTRVIYKNIHVGSTPEDATCLAHVMVTCVMTEGPQDKCRIGMLVKIVYDFLSPLPPFLRFLFIITFTSQFDTT